jgi:DNA-binding transcriptional regulator YiaG
MSLLQAYSLRVFGHFFGLAFYGDMSHYPSIPKRNMSPKKPSVIDEALNELKDWRTRNDLTQREAAEVLSSHYFHTTFNAVRSWEGRYRRMTEDTAKILLKFLREHPKVTLQSKKG